MNDSLGMHIRDSLDDFSDDNRCGFFLKMPLNFEDVEEMSFSSKFHEEINPVFVIEEIVELNQIGMVTKGLNLYLIDHLLYHFVSMFSRCCPDGRFVDHFECPDETR